MERITSEIRQPTVVRSTRVLPHKPWGVGAMKRIKSGIGIVAAAVLGATAHGASGDDSQIVAQLDAEFQAAVKANDASAMARVLHEDMILVLGNGTTNTRAQLLQEARDKAYVYERQEEDAGTQTVRVWGDTAVVTARLWVKGVTGGTPFDRHLWFSDTYVRTPKGWRYFFGQASLHLPDTITTR
jgi:ketosteroid isomerase-like protein